MSEDAYSLDTDDLYEVIHDLARGHAALCELAVALESRIDQLHLSWNGQAADAHRIAQEDWGRAFEQMRDALARMRQAADTAHHNYTSAAATNRQMWEQVR